MQNLFARKMEGDEEPDSKTELAKKKFTKEVERGWSNAPVIEEIEPVTLPDYVKMCSEYLDREPDKILPEGLLKKWLKYIALDGKLKYHFKPGFTYMLVVIPFSENGYKLPEEEIGDPDSDEMKSAEGSYLRILEISRNPENPHDPGQTIAGYSVSHGNPSYIHLIPPEEIQKCSFVASYENEEDINAVSDEERKNIASAFERAYRDHQRALDMGILH